MVNTKINNRYLKSKLFIRLFMSYVIMITLFFCVYSTLILNESAVVYRQKKKQEYDLKIEAFTNAMDMQLLSAKHIASSINSSETIKKMYSSVIVERKIMDPLLLYQGVGELGQIKNSSNNFNIFNIMLLFKNYDRAYTGSSVISLKQKYEDLLDTAPSYLINSARNFLSFNNVNEIIFNKEFFIYADNYYYSASAGSANGTILVLFQKNGFEKLITNYIGTYNGVIMYYGNEPVITYGEKQGVSFQCQSSVNKSTYYEIFVSPDLFIRGFDFSIFITIGLGFLVSILFIVTAYLLSVKHYSPFGNIVRIIEHEPVSGNEIEDIINGIQTLIGERNGYRENMITISPYAKQGMLQGILNGNMEQERLKILSDEKFIDLKRSYFVLAMANIYYNGENQLSNIHYRDVIDIIQKVCNINSTEETQLVCYVKDINNVFLIANDDNPNNLEKCFFALHKAILLELDDDDYMITFGVSHVKDDISSLKEACEDAMEALDHMLTGGRNAVYFFEDVHTQDKREYYFPKDAIRRVARGFKDRNTQDLKHFLDEIYETNINKYDATPRTIRLLVDELHIVTLNALKTNNAFNTTRIQIEKIETAVTLEEIFLYYNAIYETICNQLEDLVTPKKDIDQLNQNIIEYINENYKNTDMSLALLGELFGVSNKYISIMCKNTLGVTYLQYIQEMRIEYAKTLLQTTDYSLEQIAAMSGYSNMLTFRRNFKSVMGINPSDYRES